MIVPMSKYSFFIYHKEREQFVDKLMDIGPVHIISEEEVKDKNTKRLRGHIDMAGKLLASLKKRKKALRNYSAGDLSYPPPSLDRIHQLTERLAACEYDREKLNIQIEMMEPWGVFDWNFVKQLEKEAGVAVRFCRHQQRKFKEEWYDEYPIEIINKENGILYFMLFQNGEEKKLPVVPLALPKSSLKELHEKLKNSEKEIEELHQELDYYAYTYQELIRQEIVETKDKLDLYQTNQIAEAIQEEKVVLLEGWCPDFAEKDLEDFLDSENIVFAKQTPAEDENPPVLLKNNRFAKLFEPIGKLFSLPDYNELDLTPYFAPFFFLFFGFCLGDLGYGLIFVVLGTLLKLKIKGPKRQYLSLIQWFGLSTVIIGFISGTLFGLEMAEMQMFAAQQNIFLEQIELLQLALAVGFVQIIFGMALNVYKSVIFRGWKYAISKIGWIVLCLSLVDLFVLELATAVTGITSWIGVACIIFFGNPEGGWLKSFGSGLADLYNITGLLGDLLSYIRLFALGVSSAILGLVVNSIALSAKGVPYVGMILLVIILVVGHAANILLATLSAFVHPMRLTFVEFYKNTGFEGGGEPYAPLKRKAKKISDI